MKLTNSTPWIDYGQVQTVYPGIHISFHLKWDAEPFQYIMSSEFDDPKLKAFFFANTQDCEFGEGILILNDFKNLQSDEPCTRFYNIYFAHDGDPQDDIWAWKYKELREIDTSYKLTSNKQAKNAKLNKTLLAHFLEGDN